MVLKFFYFLSKAVRVCLNAGAALDVQQVKMQ